MASGSFELSSEALGLVGKLDALRRRDGQWIPYEHKRGHCARTRDRKPEPWPSDAIQTCAYAMLLEESLDQPVLEARVRYHASALTVRVPVDAEARRLVVEAVERARLLRRQPDRPPHCSDSKLCLHCSLAPVCLPEEERLATDPDWEPFASFRHVRKGRCCTFLGIGARWAALARRWSFAEKKELSRRFRSQWIGIPC